MKGIETMTTPSNASVQETIAGSLSTTENKINPDSIDSGVQSIIVVMPKEREAIMINWYDRRLEGSIEVVKELIEFGTYLIDAKKTVNGNDKAFGRYTSNTFPNISKQFITRCCYLSVHQKDMLTWLSTDDTVRDRSYYNPDSVYQAFNKYKKRLADEALEALSEEDEALSEEDEALSEEDEENEENEEISGLGTDTDQPKKPEIEIADDTKSGHRVQSIPVTTEEVIHNLQTVVNTIIIPNLNDDKLTDKEIYILLSVHKSLTTQLTEAGHLK